MTSSEAVEKYSVPRPTIIKAIKSGRLPAKRKKVKGKKGQPPWHFTAVSFELVFGQVGEWEPNIMTVGKKRDKRPGDSTNLATTSLTKIKLAKAEIELQRMQLDLDLEREVIILDAMERIREETDVFLIELKDGIKKCQLKKTDSDALNRLIDRCLKKVASSRS